MSLVAYHERYKKPILLSEFGADTISGFHSIPSVPFTEEFQLEFIEKYVEAHSRFRLCL
jgi:beta-glucuronidase